MRLSILPLILFFFSLNLVQAQEVPEVQTPLVTKITAAWCPPCGTWGWNLFEELLEDNNDRAIVLAAHYSGDLISSAASGMATNFGANSQPRFLVNNTDILANSGNIAAKRIEVNASIDQMVAQSPVVNTGLFVTRENGEYTIQTKTKFFQDVADAKIRLSLLAVESGVINNQASLGVVAHANVIRQAVGPSTFGSIIAEGQITAGTEIDESYSLTVDAGWNPENIEIVAILWMETTNKFIYINGNKAVETPDVSSISNTASKAFNAQWRKNGNSGHIFLETTNNLGATAIKLYSLNGQLLDQVFEGNIQAGVYELPVELSNLNGTYLISIESELGSRTVKIQ